MSKKNPALLLIGLLAIQFATSVAQAASAKARATAGMRVPAAARNERAPVRRPAPRRAVQAPRPAPAPAPVARRPVVAPAASRPAPVAARSAGAGIVGAVATAPVAGARPAAPAPGRVQLVTQLGNEICPTAGRPIATYGGTPFHAVGQITRPTPVRRFQNTTPADLLIQSRGFARVQISGPVAGPNANQVTWVQAATVVPAGTCIRPAAPAVARDADDESDLHDDEEEDGDTVVVNLDSRAPRAASARPGARPATRPQAGPVAAVPRGGRVTGGPLSLNCCSFPLGFRPTSYHNVGIARFGAGRSRGRRVHAGADLYGRRMGEPVLAISNGQVMRGPYAFAGGTYALDVRHTGGFIVRYGEVGGRALRQGSPMRPGQVIGGMGRVRRRNGTYCPAMLHFELYRGNGRGRLSQRGTRYGRRADLINPTTYLDRWTVPTRATAVPARR